jgi:hypothetical protein
MPRRFRRFHLGPTILAVAASVLLLPAAARAQICGDGSCDGPGETQCNCPADCTVADPADGCCLAMPGGDDCNNDPACACPAGSCTFVPPAGAYVCIGSPGCGNGTCEAGETYCNCPNDLMGDCAPAPSDGCCTSGETYASDPADCLPLCGDGSCDPPEDVTNCPSDCVTCNNDGTCDAGENACTCTLDNCPPVDGDGCCSAGENPCNTFVDFCPNMIGDGCCSGPETACTESACPDVCPDGCCTGTETPVTCVADCPSSCGDGTCDVTETCAGCPVDCSPCCGNLNCEMGAGENCVTCAGDCVCACGDGVCTSGENCGNCVSDCACTVGQTCLGGACVFCGDGTCNPGAGETCLSCPGDCGPCPEPPPDAAPAEADMGTPDLGRDVSVVPDMAVDSAESAHETGVEAGPTPDVAGTGGEGESGCSCALGQSAHGGSRMALIGLVAFALGVGSCRPARRRSARRHE